MKNIIDYINEYGNMTFSEKEFNKVDALILSEFSYLKLGGFVPGVGDMDPEVSIGEISERENVSDLFSDERYAKNNKDMFDAMAASKRFRDIKLAGFVDLVSGRWEMQFSAVIAYLDEDHAHVVFRGTDENIIGWKEDFNMSFVTPIPSQEKAVDYLNYAAQHIRGNFSVGGHSKGGNLAVYSAMKCSPYVRPRITVIYSQDGPGFTKETLETSEFDEIKDRIEKYVPRSSIVGMMLITQEDYKVIEARRVGILQHDPFNWAIDKDDFIYRDDVATRYAISDASVNEWTKRAAPEEMRVFSDRVFEVFESAGVTDLNDFRGNITTLLSNAKTVMDSLDEEDKKRIKAVISVFFDCIRDQLKEAVKIR